MPKTLPPATKWACLPPSSVLALDRSSETIGGGGVEQASKDLIRDAVFANANECTAAGVTLRL